MLVSDPVQTRGRRASEHVAMRRTINLGIAPDWVEQNFICNEVPRFQREASWLLNNDRAGRQQRGLGPAEAEAGFKTFPSCGALTNVTRFQDATFQRLESNATASSRSAGPPADTDGRVWQGKLREV